MDAEPTVLSALPPPVAHCIFLLLPVDARARCATVCRGWRALLADASLWTRLDLSNTSGITCRISARALRGAAARAGGALETLDLNRNNLETVDNALLLELLTANAGSLRELRLSESTSLVKVTHEALTAMLRAAPALRVLSAAVSCGPGEALALLRNEPPFGQLRLHSLCVRAPLDAEVDEAAVLALAAALPAHVPLHSLVLHCARLESDAVRGMDLLGWCGGPRRPFLAAAGDGSRWQRGARAQVRVCRACRAGRGAVNAPPRPRGVAQCAQHAHVFTSRIRSRCLASLLLH
jgi:hypothetical protein